MQVNVFKTVSQYKREIGFEQFKRSMYMLFRIEDESGQTSQG